MNAMADNLSAANRQRVQLQIENELTILAEPHHIESLLVNLVSNALKYSNGEVTVRLTAQTISILDSGPGFSEAALQQMGRPFNRSNLEESTGLGLTYCFEICRLYHWNIQHRRANGQTEMSVTFNIDSII